ncbi:MAG TPA: 3-oxoacyl-ACP reductase [Thermoleophilaceae bacterium]|nr:3-oxoacyl-ACP reductase [Thermoleophilaceae bacterium]
MSDRYSQIVNSFPGKLVAGRVGLPQPTELDRHTPGAPVVAGRVLLGAAPGGRLAEPLARVIADAGAEASTTPESSLRDAAASAGLDAALFDPENGGDQRFKALVFDATGVEDSTQLVELQRFFHPTVRKLERSGRVVVLGTPAFGCDDAREATAQRALEGFTRSLGKEVGRGSTVQLVYVSPGGEGELDSTLRFLLSPRSAYVSGQVVRIGPGVTKPPKLDWERPLDGKVALVTGASRGIGEAIATTLHRDGAKLVLLDVPALSSDLDAVAKRLDADTIEIDITEEGAPAAIADKLAGGVDIVVHNAGVTRDRTIAKMPEERWSGLMEINLSSEERINDVLLERGLLRDNGRIVCVSSMSGIAGNSGQTNYATSKAGVIGMVEALAPTLAERALTINAVAPGFIETQMTGQMPIAIREAGRRMNSMSQGGLPVDVAETIAWLASPASTGVNGNVVRVCGQSLLGA